MIFSGSLLRWFPSRSALDGRNISRLLVLCFPESPDPLKSGMDWTSDWLRCLSKSAAHSFWPGDVTATVVTISGKKAKKNLKIYRNQKYRRSILSFDEILAMFSLSIETINFLTVSCQKIGHLICFVLQVSRCFF